MLKSKLVWVLLLAVAGSAAWLAFGRQSEGPFPAEFIEIPETDFVAVAQGKIDVEGGIIKVAARGGGGVYREVLAVEGDLVEAGQVLAVLEDDEQRLSLDQSRASLTAAEASLARLQLQHEIQQREYERLVPLVEIDASTPQELDRARDDLKRTEVEIVSQRAQIKQAEVGVAQAEFRLEQRKVRAPVAGRIVKAEARPGVGSSSLQVTTAFTLMPDAQKIVRADLDEAFVSNVKVGQPATIVPDASPQESYQGTVLRVGEIFGQRGTQEGPGGGNDHVIEVVVGVGDSPLLIGQRVMVRFLKG